MTLTFYSVTVSSLLIAEGSQAFVHGGLERSEVNTIVSTCSAQKLGLDQKLPEGGPVTLEGPAAAG